MCGRQIGYACDVIWDTYADYYLATGNTEYLERAVAACRASFALMDMEENHRNRNKRSVELKFRNVQGVNLIINRSDLGTLSRPQLANGVAFELD